MIRSRSNPRGQFAPLVGILAALALVAIAACRFPGSSATSAAGRHGSRTLHEQASVPPGARGPISAAVGRAERAYWLRAGRAVNPAQRLRARFGTQGVSVESGWGRLRLSLLAYGRRGALEQARTARPQARANRITYQRGRLREWYANGPLGLEQGFDLTRPPDGGRGPLALSLALSGNLVARMQGGAVVLSRDRVRLRYGGLVATDARGRALRSWLQLSAGRILLRVDDSTARYPVHIDPFIGQAELTANDGGPEDNLGTSVATSGDTVVVGSPYHTVGGHIEQGAVYVFVKPAGGWTSTSAPTAELTAGNGASYDVLGYSVGVSGDTIVAGAYEHQVDNNPAQGAAYVFVKPAGGWVSTNAPAAELTAANGAATDNFGYSVAISGDTIVAGAPSHKSGTIINHIQQGAAYVYVKPAGGWASTRNANAELTAADGMALDELGQAVGVSGDTVVAGAPTHQVGANPAQGAVYVFVKPVAGWSGVIAQTAELTASDGAPHDALGVSVAVSGDTVAAGAPQRKGGTNTYQGAVYVFAKPAGGWASSNVLSSQLTARDGAAGDLLGASVAVSGNTVIAGAPTRMIAGKVYQGALYVYVMPAGGWASTSSPSEELIAAGGARYDELGFSVSVAGDTVVGGAARHDIGITKGQGAVEVFKRPAPSITIESPRDGARYRQGDVVAAVFACADQVDGSGLASCTGPVADGALIDTGTVGAHSFTVIATDNAGEQRTQTANYTVVPRAVGHGSAAPTISKFAQSHRMWREGTRTATTSRKRRIPVGTTFSFALDRPARTVLAFSRRASGRLVGRRCSPQTRRKRRRPTCRRRPAGNTGLTFAAHAGINKVFFQGRISRTRKLSAGVYTVTITAINTAGRSKPRQLIFTIVK